MIYNFNRILYVYFFFLGSNFYAQEKITVGYGPEDLVFDSIHDQLIVVCDNRREKEGSGEFWKINPNTLKSEKIETKMPEIPFHPIGMDIIIQSNQVYLLVATITHEKENAIIRFRLDSNQLVYDRIFQKGCIGMPNDVCAIDTNVFYYSSSQFNGEVVYFNGKSFEKVIKHLRMPNGVLVLDSNLYVSTTLSNNLMQFEGNNNKWKRQNKLAKIKGADNLSFSNGKFYCTSHPKFIKFLKHAKSAHKPSPSVLYSIDLSGNRALMYENDGSYFSAASSIIKVGNKLFVGQVFDNEILVLIKPN